MTKPRNPPRVLVVDDEEAICAVLKFFLQKDFAVETESKWEAAIEKIKNDHYDLVITDLMLPNAPLHVILHAVKAKNPMVPVVVISGLSQNDELVTSALADGASMLIPKPFVDRATVLAALNGILTAI